MDKIVVTKKNETFLHIKADPGIRMELSEHFSFYVPGYKFIPTYRNKLWDGKIRLFDLNKCTLYTGLFGYLDEFCNVRDYELNIEPSKFFGRPDTIKDISDLDDFLSTLTLTSKGDKIEPRDYQLEALKQFLKTTNRLLLSPTASGKSLIIYLAIRYYLNKHKDNSKVILIVPTTSLVEQMYGDFGDYSEYDAGFNVQTQCHKIYAGKEKFNIGEDQRIIITTWQSIHKLPIPWFEHFGMVIGDEAHSFKAKSLTSTVEKCVNAKYRLGTTGTLDGTQCFDGNTLIQTINGKKKIKDISKNDIVLTFNEKNKCLEYKPVINNFNNGISKKMLKIKTESGEFIVTYNHKIYTNNGWKLAKDLTLKDRIICIN